MARPPSAHPTDAELEILKILWDAGPSELGPIVTRLNLGRAVATTTVATTLKIMMQKGWVERRQGDRGYLWAALVSQKEATSGLLRKLLDRAFDGSAGRLVARLVEDGALSQRDRDEIRRLLETHEADATPKKKNGPKRSQP
ncbi:Predicted transcriptional regulator [Singulisphaera sp. GP187]|uniref:BlaI/MecI/CopY family transcriptional regulator n=1 Tax=Singulisphaera sp. GP187 TaxID=1882752 RepID=UPI000926ABD6|nr:BlaI/MecI/CopY family transcriptional regulator [Singulisphaera sp. GP187]SIO41771.1 Predicted transcriptional regulator [Singulisphaera sp. GP187]